MYFNRGELEQFITAYYERIGEIPPYSSVIPIEEIRHMRKLVGTTADIIELIHQIDLKGKAP